LSRPPLPASPAARRQQAALGRVWRRLPLLARLRTNWPPLLASRAPLTQPNWSSPGQCHFPSQQRALRGGGGGGRPAGRATWAARLSRIHQFSLKAFPLASALLARPLAVNGGSNWSANSCFALSLRPSWCER